MAGAGLVEAGPPQPARHALSAYPRGGAAEAGRRLGLLGPLASVVPRPPPGRGLSNIRRTRRMVST